jgi:hypothetical protein
LHPASLHLCIQVWRCIVLSAPSVHSLMALTLPEVVLHTTRCYIESMPTRHIHF